MQGAISGCEAGVDDEATDELGSGSVEPPTPAWEGDKDAVLVLACEMMGEFGITGEGCGSLPEFNPLRVGMDIIRGIEDMLRIDVEIDV